MDQEPVDCRNVQGFIQTRRAGNLTTNHVLTAAILQRQDRAGAHGLDIVVSSGVTFGFGMGCTHLYDEPGVILHSP